MRNLSFFTVTSLLVTVSALAVAIGVLVNVHQLDDGTSVLNIDSQDTVITCLYISLPLCGMLYAYMRYQRTRVVIVYGSLMGICVTIVLTMLTTMSPAAVVASITSSAIGSLLLIAIGLVVRRMRPT